MPKARRVEMILNALPVLEGAGVRVKRVFGSLEAKQMDPFLLLDHFGSDYPEDYIKGFPWHPHRGIETVTYMINGVLEHGDSLGNKGVIHSGDIQWMTAGSGIIHQEMPKPFNGKMMGFQLWINLPSRNKMMQPRYQEIKASQIPETKIACGTVKVIAGEFQGVKGPVEDILTHPFYLDISIHGSSDLTLDIDPAHKAFAYLFDGAVYFNTEKEEIIDSTQGVLFGDGDQIRIATGEKPARLILIAGQPISEPIAWYGPIVMNTQEELQQAFEELENGTFIKKL